jgi:hypothetical protein
MGECTKVEPDLCITKIAEFKGTRDAYCALKAKEIECPQQNQELNNNRFEVYRPGPHLMPYIRCDYEAGRRNIKTLLDTIIECAG